MPVIIVPLQLLPTAWRHPHRQGKVLTPFSHTSQAYPVAVLAFASRRPLTIGTAFDKLHELGLRAVYEDRLIASHALKKHRAG